MKLVGLVAIASAFPLASAGGHLRKLSGSDDELSTGLPGDLGTFNVGLSQSVFPFFSGPRKPVGGPFENGVLGSNLLPLDIWYPTTDSTGQQALYNVVVPNPAGPAAAPIEIPLPLTGDVFTGAIPAAGPHPLVVFSHGKSGIPFEHVDLFKRLASHGFVVAAVTHLGDSAGDLLGCFANPLDPSTFDPTRTGCTLDPQFDYNAFSPGSVTLCNRAKDVRDVITYMTSGLQTVNNVDPLAIDDDKIAVIGHSLGGATSLMSAGGFGDITPAIPTEPLAFGVYNTLADADKTCNYEADPRVKAIIPMATASELLFSLDEITNINIPALFLSSGNDLTTPREANVNPIFDIIKCAAEDSVRVDLTTGGHNSFTDFCAGSDLSNGLQFALGQAFALAFASGVTGCTDPANPATCSDLTVQLFAGLIGFLNTYAVEGCPEASEAQADLPDIAIAHEITGTYAVSFLKFVLEGEDAYEEFLEDAFEKNIFNTEVSNEIDEDFSVFIDDDGECDGEGESSDSA